MASSMRRSAPDRSVNRRHERICISTHGSGGAVDSLTISSGLTLR